MNAYLTLQESANVARCSKVTIRRAIAARRIAFVKLSGKYGRTLIAVPDLEAWMQRSRVSAVGERPLKERNRSEVI